jgi:hypothetical protein
LPARTKRPRKLGPTPFQAEIYRLELELYAANQKLINDAVEGYTDAFRAYEARYRRTVRHAIGPSDFPSLLKDTHSAQVVLVGDYHTLRQSQRSFFRILRKQPRESKLVIGLEMLPIGREDQIDAFVRGQMKADEFAEALDLEKRWPFGSLEAMAPVFDLARERGWTVIGLDPIKKGLSLEARDELAAEVTQDALVANPGSRAFLLFGELHLAPAHLPRSMIKALKQAQLPTTVVRVHQNPERIWFDEAAKGVHDEHEILELGDHGWALLSASPVVAQQSFLTWLDQLEDGAPPGSTENAGLVGERSFKHALTIIGRALDLPTKSAMSKVRVVGPADLSFFEELRRSGKFNKDDLSQVKHHILASESYYIPRANLVYLATLSLNHAAEEASHCLRHRLSGEGLEDPRGLVDAFYSRILNEAVGFLGSKLVNPKRKCVHPPALLPLVAGHDTPSSPPKKKSRAAPPRRVSTAGHETGGIRKVDVEAARYVLAHKEMEVGRHISWLSDVFHAGPELFNAVTHILGYILGDHLYYALVRGVLSKEDARQLYFEPFDDPGAALMQYFELVARVGHVEIPSRA